MLHGCLSEPGMYIHYLRNPLLAKLFVIGYAGEGEIPVKDGTKVPRF
jgi:hypothetical protein